MVDVDFAFRSFRLPDNVIRNFIDKIIISKSPKAQRGWLQGKYMKNNNEEFKVSGEEVVTKVKELIKAGNARKIIIKNEKEESVIEIPLTFGAVGAILLPTLAAIGAVAALLTNCTIVVVRKEDKK